MSELVKADVIPLMVHLFAVKSPLLNEVTEVALSAVEIAIHFEIDFAPTIAMSPFHNHIFGTNIPGTRKAELIIDSLHFY